MEERNGGGFCDIHGPYDPPHTSCPYCAANKGRPQPPPALEDELPTEFPAAPGASDLDDDQVTQWPSRRTPDFDDDFTQIDAPAGSQEPLAWLVIAEGPRRGHIIHVTPGQSIGRKGADVVWDDPKISRMHARITLEDGEFYLWDFGTANGTFVNGERIRAATAVRENDRIKLGDTIFVLKILP
ncbi:MAG: FHA domain-containing protein [Anaerolineae bacterium]|nr:FHA domain-containing protein [Anaerolineae bacterium]